MDILLISGMWLDASAWDEVVPAVNALGHRAVPVTVPLESATTLDVQLTAVLAAVDAAAGKPYVVGHSAASTLAWMAADARPDKVAKVGFIGGFPNADGSRYFDVFEVTGGVVPFPGWEPFDGPDTADLDEETKRALAAAAIPVPGGVAEGVVRLTDERRYDVPAVLICPEFSPDDAKAWLAAGNLPELAKAKHLEYVDIDSGHWPMFTRPAELARILVS